jgi:phosphoserine phosphatase
MPSAATDLVLQAPVIGAADVATIAVLCGAQGIHAQNRATHPSFRLTRIESRTGVAERCAEASVDYAFVPSEQKLERVRVVAIDMDSTLITIECIDEIADLVGVKREVAAITGAAMRGEIDFAESLTRRVSLLAGLDNSMLERVYDERLKLSPGAERMLDGFKAVGAKTLLVSGGFTFFTDRLKARLGFDSALANSLETAGGKLTGRVMPPIVDGKAKAERLASLRARYAGDGGISVAVGDGANDLPMFAEADISVAYRAKPIVRERATYAIDCCGLDAALNLFG